MILTITRYSFQNERGEGAACQSHIATALAIMAVVVVVLLFLLLTAVVVLALVIAGAARRVIR